MFAFPTRRLSSIGLLLVAALAGSSVAAQAGDPTPGVVFANPGEGRTAWHGGIPISLAWTVIDPEAVSARSLLEQHARPDGNGGCATADWADNGTVAPDVDSFQTHALAADTCFRWTITLSLAGDTQLSATSGSVRTFGNWDGSIDLYRARAFSTQKTWTWCTAASTQMMVNLVKGRHVHSRANQYAIWKYQQRHDRYPAGVARGSDPQGWAAALNHYGAGSYAWVRSNRLANALKKAAIAMRRTGKPVGLLAMSGHHAWVMAGFTASGDPAFGDFEVTGVYIMGPLYPLQVNSGGYYDPRPGHYYTTRQLSGAFRPYRDNLGPKWSIWEGSYVTMNP